MDVLIINADQLVVVGGQQGTDEAGNLVDTNLTAIRCQNGSWLKSRALARVSHMP